MRSMLALTKLFAICNKFPPSSTLKRYPQQPYFPKNVQPKMSSYIPYLLRPDHSTLSLNRLQSEHGGHSANQHESSRLSSQTSSGADERRWRWRRNHGGVGGRERGTRRWGLDLTVADLGDDSGGSGDARLAVGELGGNGGHGGHGGHAAGHGHGH